MTEGIIIENPPPTTDPPKMRKQRYRYTQLPLFQSILVITCKTEAMAEMLEISPGHLLKMARDGRTPRPVWIGRCLRWDVQEIQDWVKSGCPNREVWEGRNNG